MTGIIIAMNLYFVLILFVESRDLRKNPVERLDKGFQQFPLRAKIGYLKFKTLNRFVPVWTGSNSIQTGN